MLLKVDSESIIRTVHTIIPKLVRPSKTRLASMEVRFRMNSAALDAANLQRAQSKDAAVAACSK